MRIEARRRTLRDRRAALFLRRAVPSVGHHELMTFADRSAAARADADPAALARADAAAWAAGAPHVPEEWFARDSSLHGVCHTQRVHIHAQRLTEVLAPADAGGGRLPDPEQALRILWLLKDADALDRVRLGPWEAADPRLLRHPETAAHLAFAAALYAILD